MPNTAKPGFLPCKVRGGGSIELARKRVISNNTNAVFCGDAVVATSSGDFVVATGASTAVASVSRGCSYVNTSGERVERHHLPAATTYSGSTVDPASASYLYVVADAVNVDFECSVSTAQALTNLLNNFGMTLTAGSTTTGYSKHKLDGTTAATTATLPWRLIEFVFDGVNDPDAADAAVIARINAAFVEPALTTTGT